MRQINTEILVIGGGATGTGIIRDLAMRGFKCVLVERRDLAYGTTGRYHGLLHSGGRYVVKDPIAAKECYEENLILRHIMPQCIEDTGGFFILTPDDDPAYIPKFIEGCHKSGIPAEEISVRQMLKEEPLLNPDILNCFRVPDGSADSFLAADLNAKSAQQYGAIILPYHEVRQLITNSQNPSDGRSVIGALCHDMVKDEDVKIEASIIVNASGAWAGKIAHMAGIQLNMLPGKGTMVALNHRVVNTVINRCKLPSDGDILVPAHTVAVMGTTDIKVADPDHYSIEPWEIRLMLDEGEKIIPRFKQFRILRAWAGIRPLIKGSDVSDDRDISRAFVLLDHSIQDGVERFLTITGGKWTTYRKMAQVTVDKVCEKLTTTRACRTYLEVLPSVSDSKISVHYLGALLQKIEKEEIYGQLVCECELATQTEVEKSITSRDTATFDDIRRDVRLGMGPCQAAFCGFRAAGLFHSLRHPSIEDTNRVLKNFLQERWKGNVPILWGQQLRQVRFNELIYINNLNINDLPGSTSSPLAPESYDAPTNDQVITTQPIIAESNQTQTTFSQKADVVVIGAGLSGLIAGWQALRRGKKVNIITKGWGSIYWGSGCIDVFGYQFPEFMHLVESPDVYLEKLIKVNPKHPYSLVGLDLLGEAIDYFRKFSEGNGYPYHGSISKNWLLPTALGSLRPTCLAPSSMINGDVNLKEPMLIVGFSQYLDFYPELVADNLNEKGIVARAYVLNLKSLQKRRFIFASDMARLFDNAEFRQEVIDNLKSHVGNSGRIGFPAVLGMKRNQDVIHHLEESLGKLVFEIPGLPPSIPGIRLQNMLVSTIEKNGYIYNGMAATSSNVVNHTIKSVWTSASARSLAHHADSYVLATGGILGGGITSDNYGYTHGDVFNIPIDAPKLHHQWFKENFLSRESHPIFSKGVRVNSSLQPIDESARVIYENLYAVGSTISNCDPVRERSIEGIALATGYKLGKIIGGSD